MEDPEAAALADWPLRLNAGGTELEYTFDAAAERTDIPALLRRLGELNTAKLLRRLEEVAQESRTAETSVWRGALAARVGRRAKRFAAAVSAAGQIYLPDRLHEVRIATKKLRYALELALDTGIRSAHALVTALKRLQETLGRLNDLNVLLRHVAKVQADFLSGPAPKAEFLGPSEALAEEKREFERERQRRWFGRR